jgi:TDG/mug DNA glycosylase family protein
MPTAPWKPTKAQLLEANGKVIPDLIAPDLRVLFCGINPGLYSGATGHHFARPGNRFWPALHAGGFTDRVISPFEERELLNVGCGITNVVQRTTATAAELSHDEFVAGGAALRRKLKKYRPRYLAVLGIGAYRAAFDRPDASLGLQVDPIGETRVWVLPNPSGLNAHYTAAKLGTLFRELHDAAMADSPWRHGDTEG